MDSAEKKKQVIDQCRVVSHMARALASVYDAYTHPKYPLDAADIDIMGKRTARQMEILGNILNGMDAVDDAEDAWTDPIFEKAKELWPEEMES